MTAPTAYRNVAPFFLFLVEISKRVVTVEKYSFVLIFYLRYGGIYYIILFMKGLVKAEKTDLRVLAARRSVFFYAEKVVKGYPFCTYLKSSRRRLEGQKRS